MNVYQSSTKMSTELNKAIKQAKSNIKVAKKAGARMETIATLEKRLTDLIEQAENEAKYKDVRYLQEWPGEILLERYVEAKTFADTLDKEIGERTLLDDDEKKEKVKKFEAALKLIERIEDEGRKREMLYFMDENQLLDTVKEIFGQDCEWSKKEELPPTPIRVANKQGGNL